MKHLSGRTVVLSSGSSVVGRRSWRNIKSLEAKFSLSVVKRSACCIWELLERAVTYLTVFFFPSLITFCSNLFPSPRNSQFSNLFQFWFWIPFVKEYFDNPIVNTIICFERCKLGWVFVVCQRRY